MSKALLKQTLKQNWKLWLIFTLVASAIAAAIINTFDPQAMRLAMQTFGPDGPGAGMGGGPLGNGTSRFGMLTIPDLMASGYYAMLGLIMPLVYVVITGNALIAAQIDRGSMAYTLSTPITRLRVVLTQAMYLIMALVAMFGVITGVGLATSQLAHNALWGQGNTAIGAEARGVSQEVYDLYQDLIKINTVLEGIAQENNVTPEYILANPTILAESPSAPGLIATTFGVPEDYVLRHMESFADFEGQSIPSTSAILAMIHGYDLAGIPGEALAQGLEAGAYYLGMEPHQLMTHLHLLERNPDALAVASEAAGLPEETLLAFVQIQLAQGEFEFDQGIYFNIAHFIQLNLGIFLLMFAIGSISFMFSCVFNLSRNSLALGAGIPFAFFILSMLANMSPSFASLRFATINTLYNPMDVVSGEGYVPQFVTLACIGLVLYLVGVVVFKKKDLPL